MSWCDKLYSVPTVGVRLSSKLLTNDSKLTALMPMLEKYAGDLKREFEVKRSDAFSLSISLEDGFTYGIDDKRISVGFTHRVAVQQVSGGLPKLQFTSSVRPYTEMVKDCCDRLISIFDYLPGMNEREIHRIGVVTNTTVELADAPPGLRRFTDHFMGLWEAVPALALQVAADVDKNDRWIDRCNHSIVISEDRSMVPQFSFDWQRIFEKPPQYRQQEFSRSLKLCVDGALGYFEFIGEQGLKDV